MPARIRTVNRLLFKKGANQASKLPCPKGREMVKREVKTYVEDVNITAGQHRVKKAKTDGAWRYPNHVIQRATHLAGSVNAKGQPYTDPKDTALARRKIESNFFICINTNRQVLPGTSDFDLGNSAMAA